MYAVRYRNLEHVRGALQETGTGIWRLQIELTLIPQGVDTILELQKGIMFCIQKYIW